MASSTPAPLSFDHGRRPERRAYRTVSSALWIVVLAFALLAAVADPTVTNVGILAVLALLCLAINAQIALQSMTGRRRWRTAVAKVSASSFIDDAMSLPNRHYLLSEIRREIARSRITGVPFSLVHVSLVAFDDVRRQRGDAFADRALTGLASTVRRVTRSSDFLAHLEGATFVVLLVECGRVDARRFLAAIPGSILVSDGHHMIDVTVAARLHQYDFEAMYSSDVLRELETSQALVREKRDVAAAA